MGAVNRILLVFIFTVIGCSDNNQKINNSSPNFLILLADDAGYRDFGCYGNENISTPNIDKLAKSGLKFNNAFLTTAQCSPSRISVLTGKYPHDTGAEDLHMPLPDGENLVTMHLKKNNYYSGLLKKSHLGPNGDKQFDFYSENLNDFESFLDSTNSQPFFMWVGFTDPHRPYEKGIIDHPQNPAKVFVPPYFVDNQETRDDLADYYNEIMRMDSQVGEYLETLEKRNIFDNTIIIFFSDNGAPFPREKGTVYDAGIKTPLLIVWEDNIKSGTIYTGLISLVDLAPTILEIAGVDIPEEMQGNSFYKILFDQSFPGREYIFSERNWHNCDEHIRSVRSGQFKLISNAYIDLPHGTAADITNSPSWKSLYQLKIKDELTPTQKLLFQVPRPAFEFYDLINDPFELYNLIGSTEYQTEIEKLKKILMKWQADTNDFPPEERRRKDNTDRFTGVKFDQTKLPPRIK